MKNIDYKIIIIKILLTTISLLYMIFLYLDFSGEIFFISVNIIKYTSIILCFVIVLLTGKSAFDKRDIQLLQWGFFFTLLADTCLVILEYFTLGIVFFCIVQVIYVLRYEYNFKYENNIVYKNNMRFIKQNALLITKKYTVLLIFIMAIYTIINFFIMKIDIIIPIALFYSICLISSVSRAIELLKNKNHPYLNKYMIAIGMVLFLLCDINVGLCNISRVLSSAQDFTDCIYNISYLLIWLFYLPSQVLLSLSGYKFYKL